MKYIKTLGLAAVLAAALMAVAGVGAASATILCAAEPANGNPATKGTVCPTNFAYAAGTEIHAVLDSGEHFKIWDDENNVDVTCKKSTMKGTTENEGSATTTVVGKFAALTFEECTNPALGGNCTVTAVKNGTFEVHWIADTFNGTLTSNGMEITTLCKTLFGEIHCLYATATNDIGTITGGVMAEEKATIDVPKVTINVVTPEGGCPIKAFLEAKYEITSPKPLYVAAHT